MASTVINPTTSVEKKVSFWKMLLTEPLYVVVPNLMFIRPVRCLVDYYVKPAKFLVVILPRNIWQKVRRNETICCLIGFGIGVGCCILYRLISNFFAPSSTTEALLSQSSNSLLSIDKRDAKTSLMGQEHSSLSSNGREIAVTYTKRPRPTTLKRITPEKVVLNSTQTKKSSIDEVPSNIDLNREPLLGLPIDKHHDSISNRTLVGSQLSEDMTWSEVSSSLGTIAPLHDSYHSNSLTGDSGVECHEVSTLRTARPEFQRPHFNDTITTLPSLDHEDDNESFLNYSSNFLSSFLHCGPRRYDSDTALSRGILIQDSQNASEHHGTSYMSTEKGLERALEQTSRFYSDLEHIATDLSSLSKKYSQSQVSVATSISKFYQHHNRPVLNTIDALDWDWNDAQSPSSVQSPKSTPKKSHSHHASSSLPRLNANRVRGRRKIPAKAGLQTEYNESDLELRTSRSYDCTSSPLRRRPSSVYFDSTDNTSDDDNIVNETVQIPSSPAVLISSQTTEFLSTTKQNDDQSR